jgi:hypothetical protein
LPDRLCWLFVIAFGAANVRLGDQQPAAVSWIRFVMLTVSIAVAVVAVAAAVRRDRPGRSIEENRADYRPYR